MSRKNFTKDVICVTIEYMREVVSLRIDKDIIKRIEAEAARQNRSRNNLIETVLLEYLRTIKDAPSDS